MLDLASDKNFGMVQIQSTCRRQNKCDSKFGFCFDPFPNAPHFDTVPNSKKQQKTTEMWLLKDFKIQIAQKTLWKKVKLLILSNFTFFHNVFLKQFTSVR